MKSDHFDIQAVIPDGSPKYTLGEFDNGLAPVLETMLQNVLVDRFKLAVHPETREMSVYTLNVGKDGFKLQPLKESCINLDLNNLPPPPQPGEKPSPVCGSRGIAGGGSNLILDARAVNLDQLAQFLGGFVLDRPVINRTGIAGLFEMQVHFSPEGTVLPPVPTVGNPAALEPAASIFTAIQEQVGLQLQSTKGPVEVLVIDSVQKPSEN